MNALSIVGGLALAAAAAWSAHVLRAPRVHVGIAALLGAAGIVATESVGAAVGLGLVLAATQLGRPWILLGAFPSLFLPGGEIAAGIVGAVWLATAPGRLAGIALALPLAAGFAQGILGGALVAVAVVAGLGARFAAHPAVRGVTPLAALAPPAAALVVATRVSSPPLASLRAGALGALGGAAVVFAWRGATALRLADARAAATAWGATLGAVVAASGLAMGSGGASSLAVLPGICAATTLLGASATLPVNLNGKGSNARRRT